ncbi:MAG: hypothetical protein JRI44_08520 [Deltaproteobacteria bacterium]|nr:hypothetical protein [Deltaproteobacteria bacterium]
MNPLHTLKRFDVESSGKQYKVMADVCIVGDDIAVIIWGGDQPHIGSVAFAAPRPSRKDPKKISSTASVFTLLGHKEDYITKEISEQLSSMLNKNVVVLAGMHWNNISSDGIKVVIKNCKEIAKIILKKIQEEIK